MKRTLLLIFLVAAGCAKKADEPPAGTKAESAPPVSHNANGEPVVTLDATTQMRMGLKLSPAAALQLSPERKAFGRVGDPAQLSGAVAEWVAARAAADASQKELTRLRILSEQNNASARALEAAQAAAGRDSAQAESARARFVGTWGKAVADREDLAKFVESLVAGEGALVRLDLPAGESLKVEPTGARIFALGDETSPAEAKFLGAALALDPQTQRKGFLFLVEPNSARLMPGAAVTGWLKLPGEPVNGVSVPSEAVLRVDGRAWVYVQTATDAFTRKEIPAGHPVEGGWFVQGTVAPETKLVTVGAQQLLSEELKRQGGEE